MGDAEALDVAIGLCTNGTVDGALGLEVKSAMEVVGAEFTKVAGEGDGEIEWGHELLCLNGGKQAAAKEQQREQVWSCLHHQLVFVACFQPAKIVLFWQSTATEGAEKKVPPAITCQWDQLISIENPFYLIIA